MKRSLINWLGMLGDYDLLPAERLKTTFLNSQNRMMSYRLSIMRGVIVTWILYKV